MDEKLPEEMTFGEWLHQRRRLLDLTQQQLADQVGCAHITLRRIESGTLKPSKELALILLEKMGIPPADREAWLRFARGIARLPGKPDDSSTNKLLTNLPTPLTSFIGREKEQQQVIELINKYHLVTLTGSGGVGKTRLSLQAAREVLGHYPDGVWLVDFAPILDPLLVPRTTAISIGLRDEPQRPIIDMLCDYLYQKKMLLILDNCEHIVAAVASMADRLLRAGPDLQILATSREALGVVGETIYHVPSLGLPKVDDLPPVDLLIQYESIELFIDRASSLEPSFIVTDEHVRPIVQICFCLDGIPLAIELAAAKIRVLSVEQIAERLNDRFRLLTGGSRITLERHQTLRAAIDWSYNLLSPAEQVLFRRLSVFVGGWPLEAAESICGDETASSEVHSHDVLNMMEQLINKSLVIMEEVQHEGRYRMLETLRQYASEKLAESGEQDTMRDRHLDYFLTLSETAAPYLIRPEQVEWLNRLEREHDNLRAALEWSLGEERPEKALRLAASLGTFWETHCHWKEGARWLKSALAMPVNDPTSTEMAARARALYQDAALAETMDDLERLHISAEASLTLCEQGMDRLDLAIAQFYRGLAFYYSYDDGHARQLFEQSLAEVSVLKQPYWKAQCQFWLSHIRFAAGEESYSDFVTRNLEIAREVGDRRSIGRALRINADYAWENDRLKEANKYVEEAKQLYHEIGYRIFTSDIEGRIAHASKDYRRARQLYSESIEAWELLGGKVLRSSVIKFLGILSKDEGKLAEAENHLQQALTIAREMSIPGSVISYRLALLGQIHYLQENVEDAKMNYRESLLLGKPRDFKRRKTQALICICSYLASRAPRLTVQLLSFVHSQDAKQIGRRPLNPFTRSDFDYALARVRHNIDDAAFHAAWEEGEALGIDEACDLAFKALEEM